MATLLALNSHGLPSDNHAFRNGESAAGKQRSQVSLQPQTKIGPASGIAQLLNAKCNFCKSDVGNKQRLAWLSRDEIGDFGIGFRFAQLGNDIGVEQPAPHRLTFPTLDFIVRRSNFPSANGDAASAVTISRPLTGR